MLSKELEELAKISKRLYSKNKDCIFDIVLFGSALKGKFRPEDIDLCIIFKKDLSHENITTIKKGLKNYHIEHLFLWELYKEPLWSTLLHEGFSLINKKYLSEIFDLRSYFMFIYNLKNLKPIEKSKFSHALFGRKKNRGMLYEVKGKILGKGSIIVPIENSERIREFLEQWKIDYSVKRIFIW